MSALVQSTKGKLKPILGLLIVLLSVLSLFILDGTLVWFNGMGKLPATAANIIIGAYALLLFALLLYFLSLSCVYMLDGVKLTFSRVYVKNPRLSEQIMLREIVFFGSLADSKKYDYARTQRFTARRGNIPTAAILYKRVGKTRRILFSPNEELTDALKEALKNGKK